MVQSFVLGALPRPSIVCRRVLMVRLRLFSGFLLLPFSGRGAVGCEVR
jgi:hypothetical protein